LERRAELFFLLHAMRTPPRPVHLHAALGQTARECVVLVLHAVAEIIGQPEGGHDQHCIDRDAPPFPVRSLDPESFVPPFSSLLRHGFLYHEQRRGKPRLYGESFFTPPPAAPRAALRSPGTPASALRRPPSHPPARRVETRRC